MSLSSYVLADHVIAAPLIYVITDAVSWDHEVVTWLKTAYICAVMTLRALAGLALSR